MLGLNVREERKFSTFCNDVLVPSSKGLAAWVNLVKDININDINIKYYNIIYINININYIYIKTTKLLLLDSLLQEK